MAKPILPGGGDIGELDYPSIAIALRAATE
jgi:hypothetical protein